MVKKRLIPKLLVEMRKMGGVEQAVLVTTRAYDRPRMVGDPVSQAKIYEAQMADELVVLNIHRQPLDRTSRMVALIRALASETFMPVTVGGGVSSLTDFETLLENGADKVAITTAAHRTPSLIGEAARVFGSQCVVVGIDCVVDGSGERRIATDRAKVAHEESPLAWARRSADLGAGEILLSDVSRDGSATGLNVELCRAVADAVSIPVILTGGAGLASHFADGFVHGHAEGIAAGTFFAFRDQSPMQTRSHVANAGVPIRMLT